MPRARLLQLVDFSSCSDARYSERADKRRSHKNGELSLQVGHYLRFPVERLTRARRQIVYVLAPSGKHAAASASLGVIRHEGQS